MGIKFRRLEKKIERNERAAHPTYGEARIHYIASAKAGEVFRGSHHGFGHRSKKR